jgi:class 3 adenylate cyclase
VSFLSKLLVALLGLVIGLTSLLFVMVGAETERQVDRAVNLATERARKAFSDLEQITSEQLFAVGRRFAGSNRIPGALEAALEEGDAEVLADAANYELAIAGVSKWLIVVADESGEPVLATVDGEPQAWTSKLPSLEQIVKDDDEFFSYRVYDDRLFAVHVVPLALFGRILGSMLIGDPVDEEDIVPLGEVTGAEICFVAQDRNLGATPGISRAGLFDAINELASVGNQNVIIKPDRSWALVAEPLTVDSERVGARVIAVPLEQVIEPFSRLRRRLVVAGLTAFVLALGLGFAVARGLASPIGALTVATEKVASGDLEVQVPVRTRDELGRLGEAFNRMVFDLALKEKYRSLLDKVVSRDVAEEMLKGEIELGGETRPVTTLFADIRGFTPLTEGMPPERVIGLLNEVMDAAAKAVAAEGGVVDKYVGDEVMAIFGAPISGPDDARRAVLAALGFRASIDELNRDREAKGELPIGIGIGINSGPAVAGNMGSHDRLNYTVLGESVNIASRLCGHAEAGKILVSEHTLNEAGVGFVTRSLEPIKVKGISYLIPVHEILSQKSSQGSTNRVVSCILAVLITLCSALIPATSSAEIPTLAELGVAAASPDNRFRLDVSGRLIIEAFAPGDDGSGLIAENDSFLAGRLSLFLDATFGYHLWATVELRADRGEAPSNQALTGRLEQAFVVVSPWQDRRLEFQVGRFLSPFGGWPQRHDTTSDAFIRPPIPYDYRTMICPTFAPRGVDGFVRWKDVPHLFRPTGAPAVWAAPYQNGAMAVVRHRKITAKLAAFGSAPSSEPFEWGYWPGEEYQASWVADLEYRVNAATHLGVSFNRGPYQQTVTEPRLPPGTSVNDFDQELWSVHGSWIRGWTQIRAEVVIDSWEVPSIAEPAKDSSYLLEIKQKLRPGWAVSARWSAIRFNSLEVSSRLREPWDYDIDRLQLAVVYSLMRNLELHGEATWNRLDAPIDPDDNLVALQLRMLF